MKLGDGVEQAIHAVAMLSALPKDGLLSAASLAEYHGVSPSYLLKHLQSLSRAGIIHSVPGPQGAIAWPNPRTTSHCLILCLSWRDQNRHFAAGKSAKMAQIRLRRSIMQRHARSMRQCCRQNAPTETSCAPSQLLT